MQAEDPRIAISRHEFQKRMLGARRIMPFMIGNLFPAEVADGVVHPRGPERQSSCFGQLLDHSRMGGFLKDDQVRSNCLDRLGQRVFSTQAATSYVVAKALQ